MYHNSIVGLIDLFIPYLLENLVCAEDAARIGRQQVENIEFNGSQLDLLVVDRHLVIVLVDHQPLNRNLVLRGLYHAALGIQLGVAAQLGFHAGRQLQRVKRLHHIVVRSCSKSQNLIQIRRFRAQHDDGDIVGLPDLTAHLKAVHARHHNVQQHQMDIFFFQNFQALSGVLRLKHPVTVADQINLHQLGNLLLIVDH